MSSISKEVLVKLIVELLQYLIVAAVAASYKTWWPMLANKFAAIPFGRTRRLKQLNKLIAKYSKFTHAEEMEAISRVYRYTLKSVQYAVFTLFLAAPVINSNSRFLRSCWLGCYSPP